MTTYKGGVRVPVLVRWTGHIPAGRVLSGILAITCDFSRVMAKMQKGAQ
jgi:arylsulfatase A-like enzyme